MEAIMTVPVTHISMPGDLWCPDCFFDREAVVLLEWFQTAVHGEHFLCARRCGYQVVLDSDDLESLNMPTE
jgi:hypothetical protein